MKLILSDNVECFWIKMIKLFGSDCKSWIKINDYSDCVFVNVKYLKTRPKISKIEHYSTLENITHLSNMYLFCNQNEKADLNQLNLAQILKQMLYYL